MDVFNGKNVHASERGIIARNNGKRILSATWEE